MTIRQAYRFALDPSASQEQMLRSHAGAARFAWNWGLARCHERYALRDFIESKNGLRKGKRLGFPKAKKRAKCKDSFRFGAGVMRCTGSTVTLPRLGIIRTHESTRELARRLEDGTVRILSATVTRTAQRWFVSFTVEVERAIPERHTRPGLAIGADLGVRTLLTGVDDAGNVVRVPGPKPFRTSLRKLRRTGRAHPRKQPGSANRRKHAARLARIHARAASIRAGRWYPSSKTCSACGWRKPRLTLAERIFTCEACGLVMDRDVNAARNLLGLAASGAESINACGAQVRPVPDGRRAAKQEPSTADTANAGAAGPHGPAAGRGAHTCSLARNGSRAS
ncbi:MAG TPA: zinc ribbon domain-containing protein [Streptosporangiaceae bacterium]|nr:zinc ribbon domain-containing protein [Streptosporangiaceae bacterium]